MSCLLLHGLAGSPFEMESLAGALRAALPEQHVDSPLLPGHGADAAAYVRSSYRQWREFARQRYAALSREGPVWLAGYSLGGILALDICVQAACGRLPQPAGLLALATPLYFRKWHPRFLAAPCFRLLRLRAWLHPVITVPPRSPAARDMAPWQGHETVYCLRHFAEMEAALPALRRALPRCCVPLCVVQLRHDQSCNLYNSLLLARRWGGARVDVHLLRVRSPHGGHLPTTHRESRELVAALAADFACRCLRGEAVGNLRAGRLACFSGAG